MAQSTAEAIIAKISVDMIRFPRRQPPRLVGGHVPTNESVGGRKPASPAKATRGCVTLTEAAKLS